MNITIDVGNSKTKVGIFDDKQNLVQNYTYTNFGMRELNYLIKKFPITKGIIAAVAETPLWEKRSMPIKLLHFTNHTPIPITNAYLTPKTLGLDRLAAAVGAYATAKGENMLVVDIGSAITYDFVSKEGIFIGGNIAPGIRMRLSVLHEMTDKLPSIHYHDEDEVPLLGATTQQAMISGVVKGIAFEVQGYIKELTQKYGDIKVFMTGGQEAVIAKHIAQDLNGDRHLVLKGLNYILEYNQ